MTEAVPPLCSRTWKTRLEKYFFSKVF